MKIITGRAKSGKSQYIYDQIKREINKDRGEKLILLVPDLMTYQVEYDIIERLELEGMISLEVLSFKRLSHKIIDESGRKNDASDIDSLGKIMLLKEIFEENGHKLKLFKNTLWHTGFLKEFSHLIEELKQNLISVGNLENAREDIDDTFLKDKLSDIILIYSEYNKKTMDNLLDEEDLYDIAISNIESSNYIKNSKIWIDGFESFNQQRLKLIKTLGQHSGDLTLSLNIDRKYLDDLESFDDWEAFKTIHDTFKAIESVREDDIDIISLIENGIQNEEIKMIEKNMFAIDFDKYDKSIENIEIYSSMDRYAEIETTAQKIISLVRDKNYRWKDIKIAVSDLEAYMIDIKKLFHKFEIPYFADIKRDITNNHLSKYILSILDMFIWNFRYDDVFQYLKSGFSSLNSEEVDLIENYALEHGIQGTSWFNTINTSSIEDIRRKFVSDFKGKFDEFKNLSTINEITGFLFAYLKSHTIDKQIAKQIDIFKTQGKYEEASEYSQTWNSIMTMFEQILSIGNGREIDPAEYREILETGLSEIQISLIPPTIDRVEIGDIESIAVSKLEVLFILGANEGSLDSGKTKGILLDDEIEILSKYGIKIVNCLDFSYFKKRHMIYKLFTNPTDKLYMSYSLGTTDGKPLEPSLYLDILKMIFPKLRQESEISVENQYQYISRDRAVYDDLIQNINNYIDGGEIDDIWKTIYAWYKENDSQKYNMIRDAFNYKNTIPRVSSEDSKKIFDEEISMTVSKLESYAECPFKYLVKNILRPEPRLTQKIEFYDIGNIYHGVLEDFIDRIIAEDKRIADLNEDDVYEMVGESIDDVFCEYSKKIPALNANSRNRYLKKKATRVLKRTALILIEQLKRGEFLPKYTELKIGMIDEKESGQSIDSLDIRTKDHTIRLRGIIDRVDAFEDENGDLYINIIDYKSSKKDIDPTDTYEGFQVQLLVYLKAILENGERLFGKKPKIAGVYYYHIDDPLIRDVDEDIDKHILKSLKLKGWLLKDKDIIYKIDKDIAQFSDIIPAGIKGNGDFTSASRAFTQDEFDAVLDYVYSKISSLSEEILDGNFDISPYRKKDGSRACSYCDYRSICQFDISIGNQYRQINTITNKDFLDKISEKVVD